MTWSPVQGDHESCPERGVTSLWACVGDNPPPLLEFGPPAWKDSSLPLASLQTRRGKEGAPELTPGGEKARQGVWIWNPIQSARAQLQHFLGVWPWTGLLTFLNFGFFSCHLRLISSTGVELVRQVNEPADVRPSAP